MFEFLVKITDGSGSFSSYSVEAKSQIEALTKVNERWTISTDDRVEVFQIYQKNIK